MKYLFTMIASSKNAIGGITSSLQNLTGELILNGHEVYILELNNNKAFSAKFPEDAHFIELKGIAKYWNIGMQDYKKAHHVKKLYLLLFGVMKKLMCKFSIWEKLIFAGLPKIECDVSIACRQSSICYYLIKYKTTAKSTIAFIHSEFDGNTSSWAPQLKYIDHIACVSGAWSKAFAEKFPQYKNKVSTVYNLFDADSIAEKGKEQNPYPDDDVFRIVTVARLEKEQKRVDKIPEILKNLIEKSNKKIHWYLVGDGPDKGLVEANIKKYGVEENITLTGAKENPYPYIKNADLFVLISPWESYGMVIVESLILGTPVLSSEYPAVYEIIEGGKTGVIVKDTKEDVVNGIYKLLTDTNKYDKIKEACEKYEYDKSVGFEQFMKLCK